jgi:hypothetical protein
VNEDPLQRFRDAVSPQRQRISLTEAALMCAQDAYPDLDIRAQMGEIEQLGATLAKRLPPDFSTTHRLIALNNYLFGELGFAGNQDEYYDPRNSFLNDVLSRKTGIPITLSILYIDIGERLGLKLKGVSFLPRAPTHAYAQLPYEAVTQAQYAEALRRLKPLALDGGDSGAAAAAAHAADPQQAHPAGPDRFCDTASCDVDLAPHPPPGMAAPAASAGSQ